MPMPVQFSLKLLFPVLGGNAMPVFEIRSRACVTPSLVMLRAPREAPGGLWGQ